MAASAHRRIWLASCSRYSSACTPRWSPIAAPDRRSTIFIAGHVDFFCEQVVSVAAQVNGGTIKAYAVSASERSPSLPAVPTTVEAGVQNFR